MEDDKKNSEVVEREEPELIDVSSLAEVVQGAVEPFAESQKVVAQETTRQTEIIARETTKKFWGMCFLASLIIALAGCALFLGKEQITEKVLIAIVSFLGGLGFGRQTSK